MSYEADVVVTVTDADAHVVTTAEIRVEFDSPDDPRAGLARVALEQAAEDARAVERVIWP